MLASTMLKGGKSNTTLQSAGVSSITRTCAAELVSAICFSLLRPRNRGTARSVVCSQFVLDLFPVHGMNPCSETKNWAHLQIFIQPSLHLVAGEGGWGRGRHLSPLPQIVL